MIRQKLQHGFTLIEMLVIAPIVVLAIGAFLTVIISMTGEVLSSRGSNILTYNVQDALNRIEQDVKLSTTFLATNNITLVAGEAQGYNNDGTAFTNVGGTSGTSLILNTLATTDNPLKTTSGIVYQKDKPNACASTRIVDNTPMSINIVYFVKDNTLWRRTIMPSNYASLSVYCVAPWQQPSCTPGYTAVFCKTEDIKLVEGVSVANFNVSYYASAGSTANNTVASDTAASTAARNSALQSLPTVSVAINASQNVAGRTIERSAAVRVSRLDTNASTIADVVTPTTPSAPALSAALSSPTSVIYTWPKVNGADSYTFQYNVNGGAWQTPVTSQNVNTYTVTAGTHTNVINGRVSATSTAGTSAYSTTATITIPKWATLVTENGWASYETTYAAPSYTKTSAGVVVLRGLIKRASAGTSYQIIGRLPEGYRPEATLIFGNTTDSNAAGRVDIRPNGDILFVNGSHLWFSLDTIRFVPNGPYTRTSATFANSWSNYGTDASTTYANATTVTDSVGRIWHQGLIKPGTYGDSLYFRTLPSSQSTSHQAIYSGMSCGLWAWYDIASSSMSPGIRMRTPNPGGCMSLQLMWYPYTFSGWTALSLTNGWVAYDAAWTPPRYTKSADGLVTLSGLIRNGSTTYDSNIATLPVGFRPAQRLLMTTTNNSAHARIDILADGQVHFMGSSNAWYSLDPVTFMADQ